ncbi:hypothetical protein N7468_000471 [Penicillium chermesinum]|uniref:Uncharacterized protein n=1 Tax=Penicillium chermesinum TaxID=63820 RepID=A0A9W9TZD3_9EURO|nr:uncharacterized protein N7468_000471 [Penicillium chermesinum]KAJ5249020.1 hypothetical protein N7468_000471 [Penicillium chermesinum]
MAPIPTILLLGTCDTKLPELEYTSTRLQAHNCAVLLLDVGRKHTSAPSIAITHSDLLAQSHPSRTGQPDISALPRAEYIAALTPLAVSRTRALHEAGRIHGALGMGGLVRDGRCGGGDAGGAAGGVSQNARVDDGVGGLLGNAAAAVAGMAGSYLDSVEREGEKGEEPVKVGISMFGVTTPAVGAASERLKERIPGVEIYTFHATGSGGRAMERLIMEEQLDAVLDLTTTEIADQVVGGVLSAGETRLLAATKKDIPRVRTGGVYGEGGRGEGIPSSQSYGDADEDYERGGEEYWKVDGEESVGRGGKSAASNTRLLLPTGGVSMLDVPGQPFWNPEVDEVLFSTLEEELKGSQITVERDSREINDPGFAHAAADLLYSLIRL